MSYRDVVLASSIPPSIYWRFGDDPGSVATDSSGNGHHGEYRGVAGALWAPGDPSIAFNQEGLVHDGHSVVLDGITGRIRYPYTVLQTETTLELWVQTTQAGGNVSSGSLAAAPCLVARSDDSSNKAWVVSIHSNGAVAVQVGTTYAASIGTTPVNDGKPHHVVVCLAYDGSYLPEIYVDGQEDSYLQRSVDSFAGTPAVNVGRHLRVTNSWLAGKVDDFALYPGHLPAVEITEHWNAGKPSIILPHVLIGGYVPSTDYAQIIGAHTPVGYWRLGETSGTVADDVTGITGDGAYVGSPVLGEPPLAGGSTSVRTETGSYITTPIPASFATTTQASFELWNKGTTAGVVWRDNTTTGGTFLQLTSATGATIRFDGTSKALTLPSSALDNEPHHFVITLDETTNVGQLYFDGALVSSYAINTGAEISSLLSPIHIGRNGATGNQFTPGTRAHWAVYDRVLTGVEVASHWAARFGVQEPAEVHAEGLLPTVDITDADVLPTVEATGLLPTVEVEGLTPERGTVEATGLLPTVGVDGDVTTEAELAATGLLPTVNIIGEVFAAGELAATGLLPTVEIAGISDQTTLGEITTTGLLPVVDLTGSVPAEGELAATGLLPTVGLTGVVPTTGQLEATGLLPVVDLGGTPVWVGAIEATGLLPVVDIEADVTIPPFPSDATLLRAPSPRGVELEVVALADPTPSGMVEHPIVVQAHPMPPLTAESPGPVTEGVHYNMLEEEYGTTHVWVGGVDVTYLRGVRTEIQSWSSATPAGDVAARLSFPQIEPWDIRGTGDLWMFTPDATVELRLEKLAGGTVYLWEGTLHKEVSSSTPNSEEVVYDCEGTFWQAAHARYHPPFHMDPTDVGVLIADALNAVPGRRYAKVLPFLTGQLTEKRGSQKQSVLERVQELLSIARDGTGNQLTLKKIGPRNYQLAWKNTSFATGVVTKGARDITVDLSRDEKTRVDSVFCWGTSPSGGTWANWFFPGLDLYVPPPYPYASAGTVMNEGATDAGTSTGSGVSDWQRRINELGRNIPIDGVFGSEDDAAARWVQQLRGITVDGSVGPQTWNATWDAGTDGLKWDPIRLPMAEKTGVKEFFYSANGSVVGENPAYDKRITNHSHDLALGQDVRKSYGREIAERYLAAYAEAGWVGRVILGTDPVDPEGVPFSRFELREGDTIRILGHDGETLVVIVDADHDELFSTFLVDELARDAVDVDAILAGDAAAREQLPARPGNPQRLAQLARDHIVPFEDESKAGKFPRVAINGNVGLWTVLPIFVSKTGQVAKLAFDSLGPATPYCVAIFGKPITANQLADEIGDPLVNGDAWREKEEMLLTSFAWIDTWGEPGSLAGYHPWQERDGRTPTGKLRDTAGFPFISEVGGFLWVAVFTQVSCFVEGELAPGAPR